MQFLLRLVATRALRVSLGDEKLLLRQVSEIGQIVGLREATQEPFPANGHRQLYAPQLKLPL